MGAESNIHPKLKNMHGFHTGLHFKTFSDEGANLSLIVRFTADVTCMDTNNSSGSIIAGGSADMSVKVVNTETYEILATFEGHLAPILSVALDSEAKFVASSSCDGTIRFVRLNLFGNRCHRGLHRGGVIISTWKLSPTDKSTT